MKKINVIFHEKGEWSIDDRVLAEMLSADETVRKGFIHLAKFAEGSGKMPLEDDYRQIYRKLDEVVLLLEDYVQDLTNYNGGWAE
jgi:hypothetical protein